MDRVNPSFKRRRFQLGIAALCLGLAFLAGTCDNPVDLLGEVEVKAMKANDRYLRVLDVTIPLSEGTFSPTGTIQIVFDRGIDVSSVNPDTVKIKKTATGALVDYPSLGVTYLAATKTLRIRVYPYLEADTDFVVEISGVKGLDGSSIFDIASQSFKTRKATAGSIILSGIDPLSQSGFTNARSVNTVLTVNDVYGWIKYRLDYSVDGGETWILGTPTSWAVRPTDGRFVQTGFSLGSAPEVPVKIKANIWGNTINSDPGFEGIPDEQEIIVDLTPPNPPIISGVLTTTSRRPSWSWSSGGGGGNGSYRLQLNSTAGVWTNSGSQSFVPSSDLALGNNTLYLSERDNAGNWSSPGSRAIGIVPLAPTGVIASDSTSTVNVTVSWTAPPGTINQYHIDRATSSTGTYSNIATVSHPTLTYNDTTAVAGTVYYYRVRAVGPDGYISAPSANDAGSRKLTAPTGLSATVNSNTAQVTISWSALGGATRYYVSRSTAVGGPYMDLPSYSTGTSYNDTIAAPGVVYYYKVRSWSVYDGETTSGNAQGVRKLAAPINVSASDGTSASGITISWQAVTGAASYQVYRSTMVNGTYNAVGGLTTSTSFVDNDAGFSVSTNYFYKIRAQANGYYGDLSTEDAGYVGLPAVTGFTASTYLTGNYIKLEWAPVAGAAGYTIYQSSSLFGPFSVFTSTTNTVQYLAPSIYGSLLYYYVRAYSNGADFPGVISATKNARRLGLNGHWRFDNDWSDAGYADASYDNFTISQGSPVFTTSRILGTYAASFTTHSQRITNSKNTFMSADRKNVTVSYWLYPTRNSTSLLWAIQCGDFFVGLNGTQVTMTISTPSTNSASATLTLNAWNHIVGTYNGTDIKIYKNGSLIQTTNHPGASSNSSQALVVASGTSSNYWTGYLDDLRIYNITLTDSQVLALYNFE